MPALRELQRRFAMALLDGDAEAVAPFIRGAGLEPARRVAIYRNNCRETFLATLAAAYPVLKQLVGDDYFRQLVREYQERYPSRSGNLQHLGAALAGFLDRRFARTPFDYFTDVARLEWAYQEILVAAEHAPLDITRLGCVAESNWPELRFQLHPAVRLVRSDFPVLSIWSAHQAGADVAGTRLDAGGESILLRRTDCDVEMHRLPRAEFAFLENLTRGATLTAATDDAISLDSTFEVAQTLQRLVGLAVLVDFTP